MPRALKFFCLSLIVALSLTVTAVAFASEPSPTLRVYGLNGRGAGDPEVIDMFSGLAPEDPPYTGVNGVNSIFDPQGPQAPHKDSVTWNPVWMYENDTFDENQQRGLYHQLFADDINISQKVWFRMWYEPNHLDLQDAIEYPAIMEEFTYILMEPPKNGSINNSPPPNPLCGSAGHTQFVFPVGMRAADIDDPFGFGLTSLDADFDDIPDIVKVDSEVTLAEKTGVEADFNDSGSLDELNADGELLSGDELVVFSIEPKHIQIGQRLQFLDHIVEVTGVTNAGVTVRILYTGDLEPVDIGSQTLAIGDVWSYKTRLPGVQAGMPAMIALGPFFVQVTGVDLGADSAQLRIGRALGNTEANVGAGEPGASLKRFYVDGHEYNVVAIGAQETENFCFITIRTPVPKEPVRNKIHSVRLQDYGFNAQLSVMPPYNFEHYIIKDVQKGQTGRIMGDLIGPVPPVLSAAPGDPISYWGGYPPLEQKERPIPKSMKSLVPTPPAVQQPPPIPVDYENPREMRFQYVKEERNPQFLGQLLELYTETDEGEETWRVDRWQTEPAQFTEFLLPDISDVEVLYLFTSSFTATQSAQRVKLWFDPAASEGKYKSPAWLRIYGAGNEGPGDPTALDPAGYPVEVPPYTDPMAPFDPQADQAPIKDSITFNPAFLSEFQSCVEDPLRTEIYPRIAIAGHDALEKVWFRMSYEPNFLDKILGPGMEYRYPALVQEFTYMFLNTNDMPTFAPAGWGTFAFPVGTTFEELFHPAGFGLTTFDANFDGWQDDVVRVHSEKTLAALTGIMADFDGDEVLDDLDSNEAMNGDELAVFSVEEITLDADSPYAIFLDHMVMLDGVTTNGRALLQIWNTGGGLDPVAPGQFNIVPHEVGSLELYRRGSMGIVGRNKVDVNVIPPGGDNLGQLDGAWFVYVNDINIRTDTVSVIIGRALGATHSAIDNNAMRHDLEPGDPWYLKRFFVDGHEYNVVAIRTHTGDKEDFGFKYITIRTPVPKQNFVNAEDSQKLEGYPPGAAQPISVLPPFNLPHSIAVDILDNHNNVGLMGRVDECRAPMQIVIRAEETEEEFRGELKQVLKVENGQLVWTNHPFTTLPDQYTELSLPAGDLYLLTNRSWLDENGNHVKFWYNPGESQDLFVDPPVEAVDESVMVEDQPVMVEKESIPAKNEPAAQATEVTKETQIVYTVKPGDALWKIALRYDTTALRIARANDLSRPDVLRAGQRLIIPR